MPTSAVTNSYPPGVITSTPSLSSLRVGERSKRLAFPQMIVDYSFEMAEARRPRRVRLKDLVLLFMEFRFRDIVGERYRRVGGSGTD